MNFAEARAKWIEFDTDLDAAFDYIETLSVLDQMVMLSQVFAPFPESNNQSSHNYAALPRSYVVIVNPRYMKLLRAGCKHFEKEPGDKALFTQLEHKDRK